MVDPSPPRPRRLLRRKQIRERYPVSDKHIWNLERKGLFPARIQLGPNTVGWWEDEVEAFLESLPRGPGRRPKYNGRPAGSRVIGGRLYTAEQIAAGEAPAALQAAPGEGRE